MQLGALSIMWGIVKDEGGVSDYSCVSPVTAGCCWGEKRERRDFYMMGGEADCSKGCGFTGWNCYYYCSMMSPLKTQEIKIMGVHSMEVFNGLQQKVSLCECWGCTACMYTHTHSVLPGSCPLSVQTLVFIRFRLMRLSWSSRWLRGMSYGFLKLCGFRLWGSEEGGRQRKF